MPQVPVRLRTPFREICLYRRDCAPVVDPRALLSPGLLALDLDAWFANDVTRRALLELAGLGGRSPTDSVAERARTWLETALQRGHVIAVESRVRRIILTPPAAPSTIGPEEPAPLGDDFLWTLVFDSTGAPIPDSLGVTFDVFESGTSKARFENLRLRGGGAGVPALPEGGPISFDLKFTVPDDAVPPDADPVGPPLFVQANVNTKGPVGDPVLVTRRELATKKQSAAVDVNNVFQLRRREAEVIEFEHFNDRSAVFLPAKARTSVYRPDDTERPLGVDVLKACLTFAQGFRLEQIVITGHDADVSQQRADCIKALLVGDPASRREWVDIALATGTDTDVRAILHWAAQPPTAGGFGWKDCDPGDPDAPPSRDPETPASRPLSSAIQEFKIAYNADVPSFFPPGTPKLDPEDGALDGPTWAAIFNCFMRALRPVAGTPIQPPPPWAKFSLGDDSTRTGANAARPQGQHPFVVLGTNGPGNAPITIAQYGAAPDGTGDANLAFTAFQDVNPQYRVGVDPEFVKQALNVPDEWADNLAAAGYTVERDPLPPPPRPTEPGPGALAAPGPQAVGCGAHHLLAPFVGAENRRAISRHAEVVFSDVDDSPSLVGCGPGDGPCPSSRCGLYDPREHDLRYQPVAARVRRVLNFASLIPAGADDARLLVEDAAGQVTMALPRENAREVAGTLSYSLDPDRLPNPARVKFVTEHEAKDYFGLFDPIALHDALAKGDGNGAAGVLSSTHATNVTPSSPAHLVVQVVYENPSARLFGNAAAGEFLQIECFEGKAAGSTDAPARESERRPGQRTFVIGDDSRQLKLRVRLMLPGDAAPLVDLTQVFDLTVIGPVPAGGPNRRPHLHPRLTLGASSTSAQGTAQIVRIDLDLLFVDVTSHVSRIHRDTDDRAFQKHFPHGRLPGGSQYRVLELTRDSDGTGAWTWLVGIPPAVDVRRNDVNVLFFFRYTNREHPDPRDTIRFYQDSDEVHYLLGARILASPRNPGTYFPDEDPNSDPRTWTRYVEYPLYSLDAQLVASRKPAVLVFPIPKAESFGELAQPAAPDVRKTLRSMLKCLAGDGIIPGDGNKCPEPRSIGAAALSAGTATLVSTAWLDISLLDEVYILDGRQDVAERLGTTLAEAYLKRNPRGNLRLVGTSYTEKESMIIKNALPDPRVSKFPAELGYWFAFGSETEAYVRAHGHQTFKMEGQTGVSSPPDATDVTGVFVARNDSMAPDSKDPGDIGRKLNALTLGFGNARAQIAKMSILEAACIFRFFTPRPDLDGNRRMRDEADFMHVVSKLNRRPDSKDEAQTASAHRHPWSLLGAIPHEGRNVPFVQLCLELSSFR